MEGMTKYMLSRILDLQCSDTCCLCSHHRLGDLFVFLFLFFGRKCPRNVHVLVPIYPDSIVCLRIVRWADLKNPPHDCLSKTLLRKKNEA